MKIHIKTYLNQKNTPDTKNLKTSTKTAKKCPKRRNDENSSRLHMKLYNCLDGQKAP